jgi:peptidoglycan/xylan/chitin deacetylase (PgdA/CDA1 family)
MISLLKNQAKYLIAVILYYSGVLSILSYIKNNSRKGGSPLVLMYHRVVDDNEKSNLQPGLYVTGKVFEHQLAYLAGKYDIISMVKFIKIAKEKHGFPAGIVLITFDDGWRDNYANAWPVLSGFNLPATIFLTADFIGSEKVFWFQEMSALLAQDSSELDNIAFAIRRILNSYPSSQSAQKLLSENIETLVRERDKCIEKFKTLDPEIINNIIAEIRKLNQLFPINYNDGRLLLNWAETSEMSEKNIEFGSHGLSHRLLTELGSNEIRNELTQSKILIEKKLGKSVRAFSYPNGNHNTEIKTLTKEAGYDCAFIVGKRSGINRELDPFAIERVGIHNDISIGIRGGFSRAMFAFHLYRKS